MWRSLSSYARQFLGQMEKPDVDYIEGLSPAISIDQKTTSKNPRSTVGTVTEIYDYLRLLYARIGVPHCPVCGKEIKQQTVDQIVDQILALPEGTRIQVLAPVVRGAQGRARQGAWRTRAKAAMSGCGWTASYTIYREEIKLEKNKKHNIEVVVDRIVRQGGHQAPADRFAWRRPLRSVGRAGGRRRDRRAGDDLFPELRLSGPRRQH